MEINISSIKVLVTIACCIILSSCSQITPLHSARTEGERNLTFAAAVDGSSVGGGTNGSIGAQALPGLRAELAYGLTEKFDVIASVYTAGTVKASLKYQVVGDNSSIFTLAVMPGYEYQNSFIVNGTANSSFAQRLHFPLIMSVRGSDIFDYYVGPNIVLQFDDSAQNSAFPGIFGGFEIGRKVKYNVGIGGYIPYAFNVGTQGYFIQFGASARIPLYRNYN